MLDWLRLEDQLREVEARRKGTKPAGPALCQEGPEAWTTSPEFSKPTDPLGLFPVSPGPVDAPRR